jgi:acetolactate decarboxylase
MRVFNSIVVMVVCLPLFTYCGIKTDKSSSRSELSIWNQKVEYAGALKNAMKKGDLTPKIELNSLKSKENLYALGAVGYLKGEVQIFNSSNMTTYVGLNNKLQFDHTYNKNASILVYSQVPKWLEFKIPDNISSRLEFEKYLKQTAEIHGLNIEKAFPFIIEGIIKSNNWHVINWSAEDKIHTHKKHVQSGIHNTMKNTHVVMLGFFSLHHTGIFTHHTTSMHIHFMTKNKKIAGHSDDMIIGDNMILKLPKIN